MLRKPADPEEELRWISQEVRGYVEAVLSSLAANVPKLSILDLVEAFWFPFHNIQCLTSLVQQAVVLCQIEKAKEDMLNQLYTSIRLVR
jgi:dynamin GTPase